jgi:hypothetical protein
MKTTLRLSTAVLLLAAPLAAAPLMETTAIHAQPDAATPAIGYLKAGTEPTAAASTTAPQGWMAVELPGPHEAYVSNNDFSKSLDIHPGAAIRLMPKADAPILTTMQEGDKTEITGLRSGWTQIKLSKTVIGYINVGGSSSAPRAAAVPAPTVPPSPLAMAAGQPAPVISSGPASALPHTFQGMLVETKRFLLIGPRRDYDYQLNNTEGQRVAFLDVSKVLVTEKMELYLDRLVTVSGVLTQSPDGKNLVIEVESLEPK